MSNVPSTAIIAIFGIVAACLLASFLIYTGMSERQAGVQMERKLAEADVSNRSDDYLKYAGTTLSGDSVLSIIKLNMEEPVAIIVENGSGRWNYNFQYDYTSMLKGAAKDKATKEKEYAAAKNKGVSAPQYINPASSFVCELKFDTNGNIDALWFKVK